MTGDSVRVCRVETANGPLLDGPLPLALCRDNAGDEPAGLVDGLRVTQVGSVLMLRVESVYIGCCVAHLYPRHIENRGPVTYSVGIVRECTG